MAVLLEHYVLQLLFTVGVIVLTGLTVSGAKRLLLKCCGRGAHALEIATGLVGTPIHELSHAFFCLLFGHKITGIRLWSSTAAGGSLGYVTHTYRKRNLWHQIGNFFIGVAPILGGSTVLFLLLCLLLPDAADAVLASLPTGETAAPEELPALLLGQAQAVLRALFAPSLFLHFHWYLYLALAILIILHMEISASDLRSGLWGFLFLAALLFLSDLALLLWHGEGLSAVTAVAIRIGVLLLSFFCLALVISAILALLALITLLIRRIRE